MGQAPGTRAVASVSLRDAGNEIGRHSVIGADITAANLDAQNALWQAYLDAMNAITLGAMTRASYINDVTVATTQPTNGAAREFKLLVQYQVADGANAGARWSVTLPTLDPSKVSYVQNVNAKDVVDPTVGTDLLAYIAAFEDFVKDPANGTGSVTVVGLKVVGRST